MRCEQYYIHNYTEPETKLYKIGIQEVEAVVFLYRDGQGNKH